jgi:hypothetical protein
MVNTQIDRLLNRDTNESRRGVGEHPSKICFLTKVLPRAGSESNISLSAVNRTLKFDPLLLQEHSSGIGFPVSSRQHTTPFAVIWIC